MELHSIKGGRNAINRFSEYFEQKVTGKAVEDFLNQQFTKIAKSAKKELLLKMLQKMLALLKTFLKITLMKHN